MRKTLVSLLALAAIALPLLAAPKPKAVMHYGNTTFVPVDMLAYQTEGSEKGSVITVIMLADFKIDRDALMKAIQPEDAVFAQLNAIEHSNAGEIVINADGGCRLSGFLNQGMNQVTVSGELTLNKSDASHVSGVCYTKEPQKLFDDAYDFNLPFDVAITAFPKAAELPADGGAPGKALVAVIKAIQANDWKKAQPSLREEEAARNPAPSQLNDFFDGLKLNYPKTLSATGGLVKGDLARVNMKGTDREDKKLEGYFSMKKSGNTWRVVEQYLHYAE